MTIDMKSYAGEINTPAAAGQQNLNTVVGNEQEYPMPTPEQVEQPLQPFENETQQVNEVAPLIQEDAQALNFKALSDSVQKLKAEREAEKREYQLQLDMLRANLSRNQQQEAPKPRKMFDGMEDSDVPNVGELRRAWSERESAYNERIEELQVANMNPDYAEVLGKYGKHLAETDPVFLQGLKGAENKAFFAYQYAKKEQRIQQLEEAMKNNSKPTQTQQQVNAQKIVENAKKPGNIGQTGGQSALSKADYFATMSDAEFIKYASQHLEGI